MQKKQNSSNQAGMVTPIILVILAVFFVFATSIMSWSLQSRKDVMSKARGTQALQVAEAGISYYKWHLAHNEEDFQNGKNWCCGDDDGDGEGNAALSLADCGNVCGPYTETYKDSDGEAVGEYSLLITPPRLGTSVLKVESKGIAYQDRSVEKVIEARLGKKSLARYSLLSDVDVWIKDEQTVVGPLHSNGGIRMDGKCNAEITSAKTTYDCEAAGHNCAEEGFSNTRPGIWASTVDGNCDTFWHFPIVDQDFNLFTVTMADIKSDATTPGTEFAPSRQYGYQLVFDGNGGYDVCVVSSVKSQVKYLGDNGDDVVDREDVNRCGTNTHYTIPENGLIFVEDNLWISGVVKGRVTVAASRLIDDNLPERYAKITVYDNLKYVARTENNTLALMAEGNIIVPRSAPEEMEIDGILLAQKGHVYFRDYIDQGMSKGNAETGLTIYGGIITKETWAWNYPDKNGDRTTNGYLYSSLVHDPNLVLSPPPFFPTEGNFEVQSWAEKK